IISADLLCMSLHSIYSIFSYMLLHLPRFILFPYTTLFRSMSFFTLGLTDMTDGAYIADKTGLEGSYDFHLNASWEMPDPPNPAEDRKSTRLNSSHEWISYAVFCLKKKKNI